MSKRVAIYARYSSDLQNQASIEDQIRLCSEKATDLEWEAFNCYTDAGVSGSSMLRPGIQALIGDAMNGAFDVIICEALDRLSRDQEDIAGFYKRMEFTGVKILTLSEGEINTMHIGLKGTMNAMFLQDLADKTRRGLRGRVEKGKSGGGISYGYKTVKQLDEQGEVMKGEREICQEQAQIIRRIFTEYAHHNKSPKVIAAQLNRELIASPSGGAWTQSTINGNRKRGTGILNNELYIGHLVWNRQKFIKNPSTGKRVTRMNPESEWVRQQVPDLRIVPQDLWDAVKERQASLDRKPSNLWQANRPQYLLSGLLKCGNCGSGYVKINSSHYGCSASTNKGDAVCSNNKTIKRETIEYHVLDALQSCLMRDELVEVFCDEYVKHYNRLLKELDKRRRAQVVRIKNLEKEKDHLIDSIASGVPAAVVKDRLIEVAGQIEIANKALATENKTNQPTMHPSMGARYREAVSDLRAALKERGAYAEAKEHLRSLVEKIVLTPKDNGSGLHIDLHGDLAGILRLANGDKDMGQANNLERLWQLPDCDKHARAIQDGVGSGGWI